MLQFLGQNRWELEAVLLNQIAAQFGPVALTALVGNM
jgi:hypothetical protein